MTSLGSRLTQWLHPLGAPTASRSAPRANAVPAETPSPPALTLPAIAVDEILGTRGAWLARLRDAYGADEERFQHDIRAAVERYVRFVHLLPATAEDPFHHSGGLVQMGLEVSFYALQATDGVIFAGCQTITQRAALEPRWRYATFLAGLCSALYVPLSEIVVTAPHGAQWPAYVLPLVDWLQEAHVSRYEVRWQVPQAKARGLTLAALTHVVTPGTLQYLAAGNTLVVPSLIAALSGVPARDVDTLAGLLRRATGLVIERASQPTSARRYDVAPEPAPPVAPDPVSPALGTATTDSGAPLGEVRPRDSIPQSMPRATTQMELALASNAAPQPAVVGTSSSRAATAPATPTPPRTTIALSAPTRLNPTVREALRHIIATIDHPADPLAAFVVDAGVFIPLREFERRGVDPALAVRALGDARMLTVDPAHPGSKTHSRSFHDEPVLGLMLALRHVSGLATADTNDRGDTELPP